MEQARSYVGWLSMAFLVLFGYSNCSSYSDNNLFNGTYMCPEGNCTLGSDGQTRGLKIYNNNMLMRCDEDQIQITGSCNPGEVYKSVLEYSLTRNGTPINWSNGKTSLQAPQPTCESGSFNFILRRPNDGGCGNCTHDYQLNIALFTQADEKAEPTLQVRYSDLLRIAWGGCLNPASVPQIPEEPPTATPLGTPTGQCVGTAYIAGDLQKYCTGGATVSWTAGASTSNPFPSNIATNNCGTRKQVGSCQMASTCGSLNSGACAAYNVDCKVYCY